MIVQELTENEKYKFWYFKIRECKESGLLGDYNVLDKEGTIIKGYEKKLLGYKK